MDGLLSGGGTMGSRLHEFQALDLRLDTSREDVDFRGRVLRRDHFFEDSVEPKEFFRPDPNPWHEFQGKREWYKTICATVSPPVTPLRRTGMTRTSTYK